MPWDKMEISQVEELVDGQEYNVLITGINGYRVLSDGTHEFRFGVKLRVSGMIRCAEMIQDKPKKLALNVGQVVTAKYYEEYKLKETEKETLKRCFIPS